jgi:hypothetical protein
MEYRPPFPEPPPPLPGSEPEVPPAPARTSRAPVLVAVLVLLGVVGAVVGTAAWISVPGRCDQATFTSSRFDYCLVEPQGWSGTEVSDQGQNYDRFQTTGASANVAIAAAPLGSGQTVDDVVTDVRTQAQEQGFSLGPMTPRRVDGVRAVQWDVTADSEGVQVMVREVVFARGGVYWRVQLADLQEQFDLHTGDLTRMLDSWHFT